MKKSKKGFTLVELIVTIVLLGVVGAIIIYNMTSVASTSKETDYERFVAAIKSAASVYADTNEEIFNQLYVDKAFIYFTVGDLIDAGLLDENLINPYTEMKVGREEKIKANLDTDSGAIVFEYPDEGVDEESFLVALSDYVVYGENYNCMQGAGTYMLSLSDEEGNLIMLDNPANVKKYNFTCKLPSNFDPTNPGNYDVTYNWVTESGTAKSATRVLKVLAKITPDFAITETLTGKSFNYNTSTKFTPSIDESCTNWNILTYKPIISGADVSNTQYKITQQSIYPKEGAVQTVTDYTNDYSKEFFMENGYYKYTVETRVYGHYDLDYFYDGKTEIKVLQELVLPACKIAGASTNWALKRNYTVNDTYADNVVRYQYGLVGADGAIKETDYKNRKESDYTSFNRTGTSTQKLISVVEGACATTDKTYTNVYFRAIDANGYIGSWTPALNAYLTNNLTNLTVSDKGSDCATNCATTSGLGIDGQFAEDTALYKLSCFYCKKDINFNWDGKDYNVLGVYDNIDSGKKQNVTINGKKQEITIPKNDLLVATNGVITNTPISLSTLQKGTWTIFTCDGTYSTGFSYYAPAFSNVENKLKLFIEGIQGVDSGNIVTNKWRANIGAVDITKLPKLGQYINSTNHATAAEIQATWNEWSKALANTAYIYNGYAGIPTMEQYTTIFRDALHASQEYWLGSTFNTSFTIRVSHGDATTVKDTHFYTAKNGAANNSLSANPNAGQYNSTKYIGATAHVKAMLRMRNLYVCSGTGTATDPYIIANVA